MKEGFLHSRGIAYRISDMVEGRKTLVFVHGLSGSLSAWAQLENDFKDAYNIVEIDLRGHGQSIRPQAFEGYRIGESAADIKALLDELQISQCILVSHSFGTLVAVDYILKHPETVSSVIFLAPVYKAHDIFLSFIIKMCATLLTPFYFKKTGRRTDYRHFTPAGDWSLDRIAADLFNMGLRSYFFSFTQVYEKNNDEMWKRLTRPTLIIHGKNDSLVPAKYSEELVREIPHAKLVLLEHANHILPLNNAREIYHAIEQFLVN